MDKLLLITLAFAAYFLTFSLGFVTSDPKISCSQTPYPQVCSHFINTDTLSTTLDETTTSSNFHDMALRVTMNQAIEAHHLLVSAMQLNELNEQAKLAWHDCVELYEDTVHKLNRSIISSNNPNDHLTWLSASIANQHTCKNGFFDFNIPHHLNSFPIMLSNFSKLLSNSLAITKTVSSSSSSAVIERKQIGGRRLLSGGHNDFPKWLSAADRRLLQAVEPASKADIVVAQDESGDYKTISEAVAAAAKLSSGGNRRVVIHLKAGVYNENVEIKKTVTNLMIFGDGIDATVVRGSKNVQDGSTTFRSATFAVSGNGFVARDITFENTAGPQKEQAVALRSSSDHSVFYRCSFKGYQDTLYVHSQRQFYRDCDIYGTVDFICGDAVAVLQNCNIYIRKPMTGQKNTVTAQERTDPNENTGIIIHSSRITVSEDLKPVQNLFKTYLGRPWKKYARTVIMKSDLDGVVDPAGWSPWDADTTTLSTVYYGEFMNTGIGADTKGRVKWPGYHVIKSVTEAGQFTVGNFLDGGSWIPGTGVPFDDGL
ncbi:Pectinesterase [Quillaja saponaria]|uniref:Pectinesterase n=1 Tax=Quillaja saponaria TaxID=32244 RepID=A0AAD7LA68_QUISA|nr:Pectinesterase [Quillaja saponaria]